MLLCFLKVGDFVIIRDQIHGDMEFSDSEYKLISSRTFERLRYIKQLGFAEMVYPGASHNRYQHSLGVCQCVTDMYNAVVKNNPEFYREGDLELLRMMGLCHDLGHPPFSHAGEDLSDITHEERLYQILELEKKNIRIRHDYDIPSWELVYQVYMGEGMEYYADPHLIVLHSFLDGFIDADKLDYLERDSINCGVSYGKFPKESLIRNLCIVKDKNGHEQLGIKYEGVQALEGFVLARYYMFSQVYMHPMERLYRMQYVKEMKGYLQNGKYPNDVKKFLLLDDYKFARKFKFFDTKYELIYDSEFNEDVKYRIDRKLGDRVLCDVVRKSIFRKDTDDISILVYDSLTGHTIPCARVSPLLNGIEYANIHKLRYYALSSNADEVKKDLAKVLKGVR